MHEITKSPYALALGIAASLFMAVSCSDDEDGDDSPSNGGSSGSSGKGGSAGSSNGGSAGKGGTSTGGTTGGTSTGGRGGSAGAGATGGTAGTGGTGGVGGDPTDGGMGGEGGADGGMGGEGGEMTVADVLDNPGFELGDVGPLNAIPGWQEAGDLDASYVEWTGGRTGHKLGHWRAWVMTTAETYTTSTFQTVGPIPNGTYTFSMWVNRKLVLTDQHLFARGHNVLNATEEVIQSTTPNASESAYVQVTLSGIQVTSGQVTVGIHTSSWGGDWSNIDDATLTKDP